MTLDITDRESTKAALFKVLRGVYRLEQYEVNKFGLTFQQIYLLKFLNRSSKLSIGNIAKEMRMKLFSATRLADQLEEKKLIKREKSTTDRRSILVSPSKKGQALIEQIDDNSLDLILDNISGFPKDKIEAFLLTSEHFEEILNPGAPDGNK